MTAKKGVVCVKNEGYDLKYSAMLATNNYCNFLDEKKDYIPYFYLMTKEETCGAHCEWDFGDATGRYLDALILCSKITGSTSDIEQTIERLYKALKKMISPKDGLCYRPKGYDWVLHAANSFDQRSCILGFASYYKKHHNQETFLLVENLIRGLYKMGIEYDNYFFIPVTDYNDNLDKNIFKSKPFDIADYQADQCHYGGGVIIYPLMYWYHLTGSQSALELAGKISRFIVYHSKVYAKDGSFFILGNGVDSDGHFHSRVETSTGVLEYALVAKNKELQAFSKAVYDWATTQGTRYGMFPEGLGRKVIDDRPEEYPEVARHSEICSTTDMIELAILLGRCSSTDYFDHAEKYLNHLIASQLDDISWIKPPPVKEDNELCTYRDVASRYRGSYTGRTTVNDLTNFGVYDNMGCCSAAGGRGVFMLWDNAVSIIDADFLINMLLNCDNDLVYIQQKTENKITIHPKLPSKTLKIRIPQWLKGSMGKVCFTYEDGTVISDIAEIDGYFILSHYENQPITMSFPVLEVVEKQKFCGGEYQVVWARNRVVEVTPRGKYIPLYSRKV